jgi:hypothetical protein
MTKIPSILVSSSGSGYSNPNVAIAAGAMRMNTTIGRMEIWDGLNWVMVALDFESRYIRHHIEKSVSEVTDYVKARAPDNVTIQDALAEWLEACDKFKIITALAETSK